MAEIPTQELLRVLSPEQFGIYDVKVDRDREVLLFHSVAKSLDFPVWTVHLLAIRIDLNASTVASLQDEFEDAVLDVTFRVNLETTTRTAKVLVPSFHVEALTPCRP